MTASQNRRILEDLKSGLTVWPSIALREHGCFRLAARIYDLRQAGWPIERKMIETRNGKRIAVYHLDMDRSKWPEEGK